MTVKNSGVRAQSSPSPLPQLVIPGLELLMEQIQASMEATDEEESSDGDLTKDMKVCFIFLYLIQRTLVSIRLMPYEPDK